MADTDQTLDDILSRFPTGHSRDWPSRSNDNARIAETLLTKGIETIAKLAAMSVDAENENQTRAQFALHAVALHVSRDAGQQQRKTLAEGITRCLNENVTDNQRAMLIEQLRTGCASDATDLLAELLTDDALCDPAARALASFGTTEATTAIRDALSSSSGKRRTTLVQAAGELRDAGAAAEILKSVSDRDRDLRMVARWALANSGQSAVAPALDKAMESESAYEAGKTADAYLLVARRLIEAGKKPDALAIYRKLSAEKQPTHVRQAAMGGLLDVGGR